MIRILCDHHVARKYVRAFEQGDWLTVSTVGEVLSTDAPDEVIAEWAAANDRVVFTNDDDFHADEVPHGLLVYSQVEDSSPGDVVDAIRKIDNAYASNDDIDEVVPDGRV